MEEVTNDLTHCAAAMLCGGLEVNWVDCIDRKPAQSALVEDNANTCNRKMRLVDRKGEQDSGFFGYRVKRISASGGCLGDDRR